MDFSQTFIGWMAAGALVVTGGVALYGVFDKAKRDKKKEDEGADDRLIDILKQTVNELETKVESQQQQIDQLSKKTDNLHQENKVLTAVLQGRDGQTLEFQKEVMAAVTKGHEVHEMCKATNQNVERLCKLMEKHLATIEKTNP